MLNYASFSASDAVGATVANTADETLGKIEDIYFDDQGKIAYAVLSYGGIFGTTLGGKFFAVPFEALSNRHVDNDDLTFVLNVDKNVLENAPGFDRDNPPSYADTRFTEQLHSYFSDYTRTTPELV